MVILKKYNKLAEGERARDGVAWQKQMHWRRLCTNKRVYYSNSSVAAIPYLSAIKPPRV